ncbi:hypothetical protein GCM10027444_37730 [Actinopolyspora lacussalsi]
MQVDEVNQGGLERLGGDVALGFGQRTGDRTLFGHFVVPPRNPRCDIGYGGLHEAYPEVPVPKRLVELFGGIDERGGTV